MPIAADVILNSLGRGETGALLDSEQNISALKKNHVAVDFCGFQSAPSKMQHEEFFRDCIDTVLEEAIFKGTDRKNRVINWKSPEELQQTIDFTLKRSPSTHNKLIQHIKNVIKYSVKTGHPYFMNQLFSR